MVGIGPGGAEHRTFKAVDVIRQAEVVVGYGPYIDSLRDLLRPDQDVITSGMRKETQRCQAAIEAARKGATVAMISSGDAGVYGMAGLILELASSEGFDGKIEIIPGVTAASAAAAALGAPLMLDFAVVSLSDLLVPWETIRRRLELLAEADMVVSLYNPRSKKRVMQLQEAVRIFSQHRPGCTPAGVVTAAGTDDESVVITDLEHLLEKEVGMRSVVIIANSTGKLLDGWLVTPRGYTV